MGNKEVHLKTMGDLDCIISIDKDEQGYILTIRMLMRDHTGYVNLIELTEEDMQALAALFAEEK